MTTDAFTTAARAEAGRRYAPEAHLPVMKPTDRMDELPRRCAIDGFVQGAAWGYDQALAQEPTDAEAIAYLAAFVEDLNPGEGDEWTPDTIARVKRGLRAARRYEEKRDD